MTLEREAKQSSEMVDRRENKASSDQMKADGRGIERTSGPFRADLQKKIFIASGLASEKKRLARRVFF